MNQLRFWIVIISAWLFLIYNVERLQSNIQLTPLFYTYVALVVVLLLGLPFLSRISPWIGALAGIAGFVAFKLGLKYPLSGAMLPLTVTECSAIALTLLISRQIAVNIERKARSQAEFSLGSNEWDAYEFKARQSEIYREIRRARQYQRPLTLLTIGPTALAVQQSLDRFAQEIQTRAIERYLHSKLGEVITSELSHCDLVAGRDNHFVMVLPETDYEGALTVARRVKSAVEDQLGVAVQVGAASFPGQEVTFTGLLERAETEMRASSFNVVGVAATV